MKILLRLNGWEKVENISDERTSSYVSKSGEIEIAVYPPLDRLVTDNNPMGKEGIVCKFLHYGREKNNLPVFELK